MAVGGTGLPWVSALSMDLLGVDELICGLSMEEVV